MSGIIATPPGVLINPRTGRLHIESCPTVRAHAGDVEPIFTNWASRDVAIAVTGRDLNPCGNCKPLTALAKWEHRHRPAAELSVLVEAVESHRFESLQRAPLQAALAAVLGGRTDVRTSLGGIAPVLVGRLAVEIDLRDPDTAVRAARRLALSPEVAGVLLVTDIARAIDPASGKPIRTAIARQLTPAYGRA